MEQYKVRKKKKKKKGKNHPTTHQEHDGVRRDPKGSAGRKEGCSLVDNGRCECTITCNVC